MFSANFDDGYILDIIGALARGNSPSETLRLLQLFQPNIQTLREKTKELGGNEWNAFCYGAESLLKQIQRFNPTLDQTQVKQIIYG